MVFVSLSLSLPSYFISSLPLYLYLFFNSLVQKHIPAYLFVCSLSYLPDSPNLSSFPPWLSMPWSLTLSLPLIRLLHPLCDLDFALLFHLTLAKYNHLSPSHMSLFKYPARKAAQHLCIPMPRAQERKLNWHSWNLDPFQV